jgi:LAGLIDADG endonuclease
VKPQIHVVRNTPALIEDKAAYGDRSLDPWFVTGLTEGEGCFCVSFSRRARLRLGLEVRPSFSLSLNERDRSLLADLQMFFGCGSLRESRGDRTVKYESRSTRELLERVVPHFEAFPLRGSKARSFDGFSSVCRMIEQGDHLERSGLETIVRIAYEMNLGKRKHIQEELLRALMR